MRLTRYAVPALVLGLAWAAPLPAQSLGSITGKVVDSVTHQPLADVIIRLEGTRRESATRPDGGFSLSDIAAGSYRLRTTRIGYAPHVQDVTVAAGGSADVQVSMQPQAAVIDPVVVVGYGTQPREAVTGSVATIDPATANVGVVPNVNAMLQGRAAGVVITQNSGEPGAGVQIRIRGATSISASNEPLYVVDGVPIVNQEIEGRGIGIGGEPPLPRSPLTLINPSDIGSITILKDASATAIYGSRGANGVVLIETRKGAAGGSNIEYDSYVATSSPARRLDVLSGDEYRTFIRGQVALHNTDPTKGLDSSYLASLDTANTDWGRAVTRSALTNNQNLTFAGGTDVTRYRASLNYMDQEGVALSSGWKRIQGRLSGTHHVFNSRLRLGVNVMTSQVKNDYLPYENTGGFEGGVFLNTAVFNPTHPITVTDSTGTRFYEIGTGSQSVRNPVALADQIQDFGTSNRTIGNATAELDLLPGLTGQINLGVDQTDGLRQIYFPKANPVGAQTSGMAQQENRNSSSVTFQGGLTYRREFAQVHTFDIVGIYEFAQHNRENFGVQAQNFVSDQFSFNALDAGATLVTPWSYAESERWISFLSRANYGYKDKYFVTGVVRYDGRSSFAEGHKWSLFPGISGSWRLSSEGFMANGPFSELRLRVGYGVVGNPGAGPYSSLTTLGTVKYIFGETPVIGFAPNRNPNPNLTFERTSQFNVAVDYGLWSNRVSGALEYYTKSTSDLLLSVISATPAFANDRLENIGQIQNKGFELSVDALPISRPGLTLRAGLVLGVDHNKVVNLGGRSFISSGFVSGQGQSGQVSQRIMPGHSLGTFYGPVFAGVNAAGQQLFRCTSLGPADTLPNGQPQCAGGVMTTPRASDFTVIGNAYPDFTLGLHSEVAWGKWDLSLLVRGAFGQDVFNETALVYSTKSNALQSKNFLRDALTDPTGIREPAIFSSRWIENGSFVRLQNLTVGYTFDLPRWGSAARTARVYVSGDNLVLLTGYSGLDPEVHVESGLASRGIDYLTYPRPRTFTGGIRVSF